MTTNTFIRRSSAGAVLAALILVAPASATAQTTQRTATTITVTPVFATKDASQTPVRVASAGSVLLLIEAAADWCLIEYQDPALGRRTGYVETKNVRISGGLASSDAPASSTSGVGQRIPLQRAPSDVKSHAEGFFLGGGVEGTGIVATEEGFAAEPVGGAGAGLVLGYGFNRRWSLYAQFSGASMDPEGVDTYALAHFDIGTRIHFLAGSHTVVPFVQVGLAGRAISGDVVIGRQTYTLTAAGGGASFGGGINAHFTPSLAFSAAATWSVGPFTTYELNNVEVPGTSLSATSARVHLGLVWFPSAP